MNSGLLKLKKYSIIRKSPKRDLLASTMREKCKEIDKKIFEYETAY